MHQAGFQSVIPKSQWSLTLCFLWRGTTVISCLLDRNARNLEKLQCGGFLCRANYGLSLKALDYWNRRLESSWGHGYSFLVLFVCCVGSGLCDVLIACSEESHRVCVCLVLCDVETLTRRPRPEWSCSAARRKKWRYFMQYDHYGFCYWNICIYFKPN
jgi:hypothetical protein